MTMAEMVGQLSFKKYNMLQPRFVTYNKPFNRSWTKCVQDSYLKKHFFLFLDVTELISRVPNPAPDEVVWNLRSYAKIWPDPRNCYSHD